MHRKKQLKIAVLVLALIAIIANLMLYKGTFRTAKAEQEEAEDHCFEDTHGQILGDPAQTEAQMHDIYTKAMRFKERHGRLPSNDSRPLLWDDVERHPQEYGFSSFDEATRFGRNPDSQYAAYFQRKKGSERINPYLMPGFRPDGTLVGSPKPTGTRDVLAYTSIYVFRKACLKGGGEREAMGFYIVLWEDGEVQRFPIDQVQHARPQRGPFDECFPGQAGLPNQRFTYDEAMSHTLPVDGNGHNPNVTASELNRPRAAK